VTEREIFQAALDIADPAERSRYLARACAGDHALEQHIEGLLAMHLQLGTFLEAPGRVLGAVAATCLVESPGALVGPYKLLQQIGEGGMGTVYMAEQTRPVQRKVALKLIRAGMDSRQIGARFEAERQALALMDHPNIARVLDAGAAPDGRPYFVMDLVKGVPITAYCDAHRLTPAARLGLFLAVCQAVQHAHQKGIIHRDLKPSNVLVAEYDERPVVKVIDFGVAKATGPKLTDRTMFTEFGQIIGTVEYMSPEQAKLNALDVDTRSDIYALGVLVYELLTGTTPLEQARLRDTPFDEVLRIIREEEPTSPSQRLSTLAELPTVATNRGLDAKQLDSVLRGELDWIVMKCLEKDRDRRYQTAGELAQDVERYLRDEPVAACPPSRAYRLRKFIRRHRGAVAAVVSIAVLLVAGIIGTTTGLVYAEWSRRDAVDAQQQEEAQRKLAEAREAETRAVLDFVETHVFAATRPTGRGGLGRDVTVERAVTKALSHVDQGFKDQPLTEARLRLTLGLSFYHLGKGQLAADQCAAARAIYSRLQGPNGLDTLRSVMLLADCYELLARHKEALALREEALARRQVILGYDHPDTLRCMMSIANSLRHLGRFEESVKLQRETLELRTARLGLKDPETLRSMNNLASSLYDAGHHQEALALREETLTLRREVLGDKDIDTLLSIMALANSYFRFGRYPDAVKLYDEALQEQERQLTREHPATLSTMNNLANAYGAMGEHKKALALRVETLETRKRVLGVDHEVTLGSMTNLAASLSGLGRHKDAIALLEKTLKLQQDKLGPNDPDTLLTLNNLADSYDEDGRHEDALKSHRDALARRRAKLGMDHPDTLLSMWGEAISLTHLKRGADAVQVIDECLRLARDKVLEPGIVLQMIDTRLRHFEKCQDAAGCRASAEMWENQNRHDAGSLYNAACFRAVTARVTRSADTPDATARADADADQAIAWLRQAVAAGYHNAAAVATDHDLDDLRGRADFKGILTDLKSRPSPRQP
jgi:serine/threonine protein kinase/tetratricopeptide (TPR) repeat protein